MIKELSLDIKDTFIIKHLIGCESLKIFNLKIDSSLDVTGIDFSSLNVCKNLESINISAFVSLFESYLPRSVIRPKIIPSVRGP